MSRMTGLKHILTHHLTYRFTELTQNCGCLVMLSVNCKFLVVLMHIAL